MLCKLVADKRFRKPLGQLLRGICAMQRKLSEIINGWSSYFILFWAGSVDGLNVRSIEGNIGMECMWESNVALWSSQQKKLHWKLDDVKTIDMENSFEYFYLSEDYNIKDKFENSSRYEMLQELKSMFEKQAGVEWPHYNKHNMGKTVGELHAMLIEYAKGLPKKAETPQVMMIRGGKIQKANKKSLNAKGKYKVKGKGKDKKVYIPKPKNPKPSAKEHPAKDDAYHHCKEVGHCKRNCPTYLAELIKKKKQVGTASSSDVFIIELFSFPTKSWVYDTSCGTHICNTKYGLGGVRKLKQVEAIGSLTYTKRAKHNLDSTYLWHCRLAHICKKRIKKLQQEGLLKSTDDESFDQCVSCLSGKMTRKSLPHRPERATDLLGIIHTDVCGPLRHVSRQGASYFITFTDDYSRYGYVYLLKHKHEAEITIHDGTNGTWVPVDSSFSLVVKLFSRTYRVECYFDALDSKTERDDTNLRQDRLFVLKWKVAVIRKSPNKVPLQWHVIAYNKERIKLTYENMYCDNQLHFIMLMNRRVQKGAKITTKTDTVMFRRECYVELGEIGTLRGSQDGEQASYPIQRL
ncbi:retrotransposon protein, putative, ty1-copia subclass [Tanacetum coccineum]